MIRQEFSHVNHFRQSKQILTHQLTQTIDVSLKLPGAPAKPLSESVLCLVRLCKLFQMVMNMTRIVRLDDSTDTSLKGEPYLMISSTSQYILAYDDKGSGAASDERTFPPLPGHSTYSTGSYYAHGNYNWPEGGTLIVKAVNDEGSNIPLLKPPIDYVLVWNDRGTGGRSDGAIWQPVAPDGYVALGAVADVGYSKPYINNYRCLRQDLVTPTQAGNLIWNDRGSGGDMDVELWRIPSDLGLFKAQGNYYPPTGDFMKIIG